MRFPSLSLSHRFSLVNLVFVLVLVISSTLVIRSLYDVEDIVNEKTVDHIDSLSVNSSVSREIFQLMSRVQLLEKTFLYDDNSLIESSLYIDNRLQTIRAMSKDELFSELMDRFIENFNRFLGNSLGLNNILSEHQELDKELGQSIDDLELTLSQHYLLELVTELDSGPTLNPIEIIAPLRENYLNTGKLSAAIDAQITQDIETVILIKVVQELEIMELNLNNITQEDSEVISDVAVIKKLIAKYKRILRKIEANLKQRWGIMDELIASQSTLLDLVAANEKSAQHSALEIKNQIDEKISNLRSLVIAVSLFIIVLGVFTFNLLVRKHIHRPMRKMIAGIEEFEEGAIDVAIKLDRDDEWQTIEQSFNKMTAHLQESYEDLRNERVSFDYLAHHDPLTGLANRLFAYETINRLIENYSKTQSPFGLLFLDLDEFKNVNDSMGHSVGDELLIGLARQLVSMVGDQGYVIRLGGDEFMVIFSDIQSADEMQGYADKLNESFTKPYELNDNKVVVTSSIGLCVYPDHGDNVDELVRNADTAMYRAKKKGRNSSCYYHNSMTKEAQELMKKSAGIHRAIENNEFMLFYQPQYSLVTGALEGAEALIRWQHPELGILSPDEFLPVAEQTGLISDVDDWVFSQVVKQIDVWKKRGINFDDFKIALNFSGRKFLEPNLLDKLEAIIRQYSSDPGIISLEITEQDLMTNLDASIKTMVQLRRRGYTLAIDDFGTGYSSFSYLKNLPADVLKIDRAFIHDIEKTSKDMAIVQTMISLAKMMGMQVVAEGIEYESQKKLLSKHGCDKGQGYHLSRPVHSFDLTDLLIHEQQKLKKIG